MNSLGNSIVESTFISWTKPCTIIFSDKTESNEHSPREVHSSLYKSKPAKNSFDVNKPGYIYFFAYKVYGKNSSIQNWYYQQQNDKLDFHI